MKKIIYFISLISLFVLLSTGCTKDPPIAAFTMSKTTAGVGEMVLFTNVSENANSYSWDFGDGGTSTAQSLTYKFSTKGDYTVTLTAIGEGGEDSVSESIIIERNFNGYWKVEITQSDITITSAWVYFYVDEENVSLENWEVQGNIGANIGSLHDTWHTTLNSNNECSFTLQDEGKTFTCNVKLETSTTGIGTFIYNGKSYPMQADKE